MDEVVLTRDGISIHGEKKILLCASLFYFRIPRGEWEDRILKLKASGYNCADVYFPWNFHETAPSCWDFGGDRDAEEFLRLLELHGLFVIARPGPYICSEWDGGGIPAWVLTDRSLRVRQNDRNYLAHVRRWYEKILPILAAHQIDSGGTVILMQLENELDFYDCDDPRGYMDALHGMARGMGITVPLFGCAGQSDAASATGNADGVEVTFNFYGDSRDPDYGEKFHYYYGKMREADRPFLISETNCDHLFLRRELAAGAKLLGAYSQVGGMNFGFTGGVNNWGERNRPVSFITTMYTHTNMIGPAGELQEQYYEGRRLAGLIHTFGSALGGAESFLCESGSVRCDFPSGSPGSGIFRLDLSCGGALICVPNLGKQAGTVEFDFRGTPFRAGVPADSAPFFPFDIPLSLFGRSEGTLIRANGEPEDCSNEDGTLTLTFWTESAAPFAEFSVNGRNELLTRERPACCGIRVLFLGEKELRNRPLCGVEPPPVSCGRESAPRMPVGNIRVSHQPLACLRCSVEPLRPLEECGVYRGAGSYRFPIEGKGVLLLGGADVVAVYRNGDFEGAYASAGAAKYHVGSGLYEIPVVLWGHSNFSDSRLPALKADSARGLGKAVDVRSVLTMESNWFFSREEGRQNTGRIPGQTAGTLIPIGAWNSTRAPLCASYRKTIRPRADCDSFILEMRGLEADAVLYADGQRVGRFNPRDPFLDFSGFAAGKGETELTLCLTKRSWDEPAGIPLLYSGKEVTVCEFTALTEDTLLRAASGECKDAANLPLVLRAGEVVTVAAVFANDTGGRYLRVAGRNLFAAAFAGDKILGRVLLWDASPRMAGDAGSLYVPRSFSGREIRFLVAALGENAELTSVLTEPSQDVWNGGKQDENRF